MPKTTTAKNAKKCKEPQRELEVESFPITTTRGSIAKRNPLPADMIEAMQNAMQQKWKPTVSADWYHVQDMTYSKGPNW
jgi:hypothetical protein